MGSYNPAEPLAQVIEKLEKGREFAQEGGQIIANTMMVSKGITLMAQIAIFNKDIREWRCQATDQRSWEKFKIFFHQSHREKRKVVTIARKGGYIVTVQNIYCVPPNPPEEHNEEIDHKKK